MEETKQESAVRRALRTVLGGKAEQVPLSRGELEQAGNERLARERLAQLQSGVIPARGRGSNGGTTPLPEGKGWRPHVGRRQRERGLRQTWAQFEKLCKVNPWYATTRERLLDAVADQPDSEFAAMNIALGAKLASEQKKAWLRKNPPPDNRPMVEGTEWVDALNAALNHFEAVADKTRVAAAEAGAQV